MPDMPDEKDDNKFKVKTKKLGDGPKKKPTDGPAPPPPPPPPKPGAPPPPPVSS